jgi:hypothetical protein
MNANCLRPAESPAIEATAMGRPHVLMTVKLAVAGGVSARLR